MKKRASRHFRRLLKNRNSGSSHSTLQAGDGRTSNSSATHQQSRNLTYKTTSLFSSHLSCGRSINVPRGMSDILSCITIRSTTSLRVDSGPSAVTRYSKPCFPTISSQVSLPFFKKRTKLCETRKKRIRRLLMKF